jgi:5-methylcytosine-specific restriction enzyme B
MNNPETIPDWHETILQEALAWREAHPDFRFSLRTSDLKGTSRLSQGYWFPGSNYLFFPPFKPNDTYNKTKTIGFVIKFNSSEQPAGSYIEVVFGSLKDDQLVATHRRIVEQLGGFERRGVAEKYQRPFSQKDPVDAFREFLEKDHPRILQIIEESGRREDFLVSEGDFRTMLDRIESLRDGGRKGDRPEAPEKAAVVEGDPLNLILFGPPGTGKTHWLREKLKDYQDAPGRSDHDQWLQQTVAGYGWRAVIAAALAELGPARVPEIHKHPWITAKIKERGRVQGSVMQSLWGYLSEHTPEEVETVKSSIRRAPFIFTKTAQSVWQLVDDWEEQDPEAVELREILAKGPSQARSEVRRYRLVTFHPSFTYEDFIRGIRPVSDEETDTTQFRMVDGIFKEICDEARANPGKRYALFIDEINRANISKVFGELITLIEPDKRGRYDETGRMIKGLAVRLPGGREGGAAEEPFSVPANLDIYGTMNTADRSIALLDIALRRRFQFREMPPDYALLDDSVGDVHLGKLLARINDRLEYLIDRDHRIGHSYLMKAERLEDLQAAFQVQIIPLLQEFFFDDFSRVALVLATSPSAPPFVRRDRQTRVGLFPQARDGGIMEERDRFEITRAETWTEASFLGIYDGGPTQPANAGAA